MADSAAISPDFQFSAFASNPAASYGRQTANTSGPGGAQSGDVRRESRVGFARQQAIERGYLNAESPRGLWQLTEAGEERLCELEAVSAEAGGSER